MQHDARVGDLEKCSRSTFSPAAAAGHGSQSEVKENWGLYMSHAYNGIRELHVMTPHFKD